VVGLARLSHTGVFLGGNLCGGDRASEESGGCRTNGLFQLLRVLSGAVIPDVYCRVMLAGFLAGVSAPQRARHARHGIRPGKGKADGIRSAIVVRQRFFGMFWPLFLAGSGRLRDNRRMTDAAHNQHSETRRPSDRDRIVTTGPSRFQPARPEVLR